MIGRWAGRGLASAWRLLAAFGLAGLLVWPAAIGLGYDLVEKELARADGIYLSRSTLIGRDFVNIWHGGREAARGGAAVVYDRNAYRKSLEKAVGIRDIYAFSYPPHMLMLSVPFGVPGYIAALVIWTVGGLVLFWRAALPWLHDVGLPGAAVLLLPGALVNVWAGHFGFLIGALALLGWRGAGTRPIGAGFAFAMMTVKPHMGVLVPLILALQRDWRTIGCAAGVALALAGLSAALFGTAAWSTWLGSTLAFQVSLIDAPAGADYGFMMPTPGRMLLALSADARVVLAGQAAIAAIAFAIIVWAWHCRTASRDLGLLSIAATPLLLPYSFNYDLVALSLVALVFARRWRGRWYAPDGLVYGAAFLVPIAQVPLAREGYWLSPIAIIALLALAGWRMTREADTAAP